MKKQWNRLLIAALCSSSVFAATIYWYQSTEQENSSHGSEKPVAYVGKVVDDIQRRPAARLLWQLVDTGDPLYNGEAVRTSEHGEVRIQFSDSDRYLDLEPESLIVIKKSEGEIALDLMEGSLFVNSQTKGPKDSKAPGLVLSSASGKVDLSNASASLSKGQGSAVDVQVIEGKASILSKDGKNKELSTGAVSSLGTTGGEFNKSNLKILSPAPHKPIAMDAKDLKPVLFKWTGFPANSEVSLWVGGTRKEMKVLSKAGVGLSSLSTTIPFGKHYWKLVASTPQGQVLGESTVYRTEIIPRYPPTVVFPTADAEIPANNNFFDMSFKWEKSEDTRTVSLEVASDPDFKKKIASKSFATEESYTLPALKAGTYYWRMKSYFVDSEKPVEGSLQKFTIKSPDAPKVVVKPPPVPVHVAFTIPEQQTTQYFVEKPQLGLTWNTDKMEQVATYRVKVLAENEDPATVKPVEIKETKWIVPVPKAGRYIASIEAVNKDGDIVGTSTSPALNVTPLPILKAPDFLPKEGPLQASQDGRSQIEWSKIEGAKEYWLTIKKDGKELKHSKYTANATALKNLLPGEYEVQVSAVDNYGRSGEISPVRKLLVPDKSGLRAPSIKKIKVN